MTMVVTRGVEIEVEEAAQVPKAGIVEDQLTQDLEAGTVEKQVEHLLAFKVEEKVDNKAQLRNVLFIRRSPSFHQ